MIKSGTSRFMFIAALLAGATTCLASGVKEPDWSYTYTDNFQDCNVENDSYYHSIFWPQGAFPPSEPYLFYKDTGTVRELGLGDFHGQPAQLAYRFPFGQGQLFKTISGELRVDVRFAYANTGSLQYSLSSDGIILSPRRSLVSGTNIIPLKSIRGECYITFYGIGVLIDNLEVDLYSYPADYLVPSPQCPTLQAAIDLAHQDDVNEVAIEVAPNTSSTSYKWHDIDFKGKAITVYGKMGSGQTFIDCEGKSRGFYFHQAEDANSVLRGFSILNGKKTGYSIPADGQSWRQTSSNTIGAGIFCEFSSPSIVNCVIRDCSTELGGGIGLVGSAAKIADCLVESCDAGGFGTAQTGGYGAGIALIRESNAVIINTVIRNNSGYYSSKGAGVYCFQSKVLMANCEIRFNSALGSVTGGGVYAAGAYTNIELRNCIIADNTAQSGAGIYSDSINVEYRNDADLGLVAVACLVRINNCTIANNKLLLPAGITGGGIHSVKSDTFIRNSIIWGNNGQNTWIDNSIYTGVILYSDIQGGFDGQGNKNVDPCFASSATGDYHLKSKFGRFDPAQNKWISDSSQSECIDAGDPLDQVGPEPYPNGKRINMGAYGGTNQASMNFTPRILHVSKTGNDANTGLSKEIAFAKIQKAVTAALEGDVIMIWPGIYTEDVRLYGTTRKLTIQSADDAAEVRSPTSTGHAFSFYGSEDSGCVLRNLIITNSNIAIYCENASPTLINLTIANNAYGISNYEGANPNIKNCIFLKNTYDTESPSDRDKISYSRFTNVRQIDKERGNIDADPSFINSSAANGDYHLKSYSPCIDAGDPSMYPEREPQPNGGRINMGAHGGTPYASKSAG